MVHSSSPEEADPMSRQPAPRPLTATVDIAAPPARVWDVVADVRRTGEWSPECRRVVPLGRLRSGALLVGMNRRGRVRWVTLSRVVAFRPGEEIGWVVLTNRSEWRYRLAPSGTGTSITETRRTPRGEGRFALWFTRVVLDGQGVHDAELERGMADGLRRIKAVVEGDVRASAEEVGDVRGQGATSYSRA
jgi:uncharacterized protein YndB with AHSA1/START domain